MFNRDTEMSDEPPFNTPEGQLRTAEVRFPNAPAAEDIEDLLLRSDLRSEKFRAIVEAVGSIGRQGTGLLIAQELLLTAGHCVRMVKRNLERANGRPLYVDFNYQDPAGAEGPTNVIKYQILSVVERETPYDYGFLRVKPQVADKTVREVGRAAFQPTLPVSSYVTEQIIVVGHPAGSTKKGSIGPVVDQDQDNLFYTANTETSSSGSPVIRLSDFSIIALHCKGVANLANVGLLCTRIDFPT